MVGSDMILLPTALPWTTDASRNIQNDKKKTTSDWARYWSEVVPTSTLPGRKWFRPAPCLVGSGSDQHPAWPEVVPTTQSARRNPARSEGVPISTLPGRKWFRPAPCLVGSGSDQHLAWPEVVPTGTLSVGYMANRSNNWTITSANYTERRGEAESGLMSVTWQIDRIIGR